ncbi:DUF5615 family PIN-like protein [Moorena sp. SIO4G3]|nr:DUF5615 family PIN-like protein [Moorena sp. SIO4G3]
MEDAGVGINDLWIACTAIQHNLIIVSEDRDYRKIGVAESRNECAIIWF